MGILTTTRQLVNNTGNVKCKTQSTMGGPRKRIHNTNGGCNSLNMLYNLNYTEPPATYKKASKILLPELYAKLGLNFPTLLNKYSKKSGIVVMSGDLMYIHVDDTLYIILPPRSKNVVKAYINSGKAKQNSVKARAAGQRQRARNMATGVGRLAGAVVNP